MRRGATLRRNTFHTPWKVGIEILRVPVEQCNARGVHAAARMGQNLTLVYGLKLPVRRRYLVTLLL